MAKKTKKDKRKARTKEIKKVNLLKPVDITQLGSEEDPCFGKLFDPKAVECSQLCGDCELCQIVMNQKNHIMRDKLENKTKFKDIEEKSIYGDATIKDVKKDIRLTIKAHKKMALKQLVTTIASKYTGLVNEKKVDKIVKKMLSKTDKFKLDKNQNLIWGSK